MCCLEDEENEDLEKEDEENEVVILGLSRLLDVGVDRADG